MMMNLFSIFDPVVFWSLGLNWFINLLLLMFLPFSFWLIFNRYECLLVGLLKWIFLELKVILFGKLIYNLIFFVVLFYMLIMVNFMGLFPYIFTSSSHMVYSMSFSLLIWLMIMIFGWLNYSEDMFCHMLPLGTPSVLMVFMILIETVSNIIRSLTLSIRLSANMIAGHLLLTLIGEVGEKVSLILVLIVLLVQLLLFMLEISVCLIQAFVFTVLSSLYLSEI